ncbi:MAG: glycine zipper domain-containing protein, partial [Nitrospirota bacterium]
GAATGAAAGARVGSEGTKTELAVLGGFMGALTGGFIGHYAYDKKRGEQETINKYNYRHGGLRVNIEEAQAIPKKVEPGGTVDIAMAYALLGADHDTPVTEVRDIRHNGKVYSRPEIRIYRGTGTYSSIVPIRLPLDAKKGKYTVIASVKAGKVKHSRETSFYIR